MEPSLQDLINFRVQKNAERAAIVARHKQELEPLDDILDGLDELILDGIPQGVDSVAVHLSNGGRATARRVRSSQFRLEAGKSDEFFDWVAQTGSVGLLHRAITQSEMLAWVHAHDGNMPPAVYVHPVEKLSVLVQSPAPSV
jgi:hypothetical protein